MTQKSAFFFTLNQYTYTFLDNKNYFPVFVGASVVVCGPAHFFLLAFLFNISIQEEKNESGAELKLCSFHCKMIYFGFVCCLFFYFFFLVWRSQNKCLVFSGCLQRAKMLKGPLSACCGQLCGGMLRNALQRCLLLWLHRVSSFLQHVLDLGLLLLLCSLVLSEAFLAQTLLMSSPQ